jgi:hypothetical protein
MSYVSGKRRTWGDKIDAALRDAGWLAKFPRRAEAAQQARDLAARLEDQRRALGKRRSHVYFDPDRAGRLQSAVKQSLTTEPAN